MRPAPPPTPPPPTPPTPPPKTPTPEELWLEDQRRRLEEAVKVQMERWKRERSVRLLSRLAEAQPVKRSRGKVVAGVYGAALLITIIVKIIFLER